MNRNQKSTLLLAIPNEAPNEFMETRCKRPYEKLTNTRDGSQMTVCNAYHEGEEIIIRQEGILNFNVKETVALIEQRLNVTTCTKGIGQFAKNAGHQLIKGNRNGDSSRKD
ncbi:hypothetical protein Tco_1334914 [Tanacetum coccineum]